ncbi:hypothetical protein RBB50_010951 [Rhinocladiella similis]
MTYNYEGARSTLPMPPPSPRLDQTQPGRTLYTVYLLYLAKFLDGRFGLPSKPGAAILLSYMFSTMIPGIGAIGARHLQIAKVFGYSRLSALYTIPREEGGGQARNCRRSSLSQICEIAPTRNAVCLLVLLYKIGRDHTASEEMKYVPSPQALRLLSGLARGQTPTTTTATTTTTTAAPLFRFRPAAAASAGAAASFLRISRRHFHATTRLDKTETHVLSDIGEGVKEVQIIQWFVEEGAPIEEWSPLCEVQSDKASVEITSKYTGVIKKLHFGQDAVVQVGDPLLDIEVEGSDDAEAADEDLEQGATPEQAAEGGGQVAGSQKETGARPGQVVAAEPRTLGKHASLATPAVRGLLKEHGLAIEDITGTGKDGRVLKEDVYKHLETSSTSSSASASTSTPSKPSIDATQTETPQKLTPVQSAMFKSMTGSLSIPHFLYSDTIDISNLSAMRARLNSARNPDTPKLTYMPFIIKAVSLALSRYPLLNARLDLSSEGAGKPHLIMRNVHNIGVAMDTPNGLIVPVIKNVNARSIVDIAQEVQRLAALGQAGKLSQTDLTGGTITVSNIGNIGGETVAPVIVEGQLAIMGVGKIKKIPVFAEDGVTVRPAQVVSMSWSADHRVVDGATMARMATVVQRYLEEPGSMIVDLS